MSDSVSVVILTKNNIDTIDACLYSVLKQTRVRLEIIIVDGGSTDGTYEQVLLYVRHNGYHTVDVYEGGNIGESRQLGVEKATNEYIAFIDSDCELFNETWISLMLRCLRFPEVAGSWALACCKKQHPSIARYSILSFWALTSGAPLRVTKENYYPVGCGHIVLKKSVIQQVGGFKALPSGEDIDLTLHICAAGYELFCPCLPVYHLHAKNFKQFMGKYKRDVCSTIVTGKARSGWRGFKFFCNNIIFPIPVTIGGLITDRDFAWLWHPVVCYAKCFIVLQTIIKKHL